MKGIGIGILAVTIVATSSLSWAVDAPCTVRAVPRVSEGRAFYEVVGSGFGMGEAVTVEVQNGRRRTAYSVIAGNGGFSGIYVGKGEAGVSSLASGRWRIRTSSASCTTRTRFTVGPSVPAGEWGGDHVAMTVTATETTFEFDCAHGSIEGPLVTDASGAFDVFGTIVLEHGGPVFEDETEERRTTRFIGWTDGSTLTLTGRIPGSDVVIGPYTLGLAKPARVVKCL